MQPDEAHLGRHEIADPAIHTEFGRSERQHDEEQNEIDRLPQRAHRKAESRRDDSRRQQRPNELPVAHVQDAFADLHADEIRRDKRAERAEVGQHFAIRHARRNTLAHGETLAEEHHAVDRGGDESKSDAPLPGKAAHRDAEHPGERHAARPAGMEDVQPLRLFARIHGGDGRVDVTLHGAVREGEDEGAPVKLPRAGGRHEQDRRDDVAEEPNAATRP